MARRLAWPGLLLALVVALWTVSLSDADVWATAVAAPAGARGHGGRGAGPRDPRGAGLRGHRGHNRRHDRGTVREPCTPNVLVSSTDAANNLTVSNTASAHYALTVMTVVAGILFPLVLVYQGWTYYVVGARVSTPASRMTCPSLRAADLDE